jgi:hypothetical protein
MDAPLDVPPPPADCAAFIAIAHALRRLGLQTPDILAADIGQGFLLLTDFGDQTYLKTLLEQKTNIQTINKLYHRALYTLSVLQHCHSIPETSIPLFDEEKMQEEWAAHKEWFLQKLLHIDFAAQGPALDTCFALLINAAIIQPQVFMHRDYQSANLMVLPDSDGVGILDFQHAFIGPITYDLASLLRDCYIDWPIAQVHQWVHDYWQLLQPHHSNADLRTFLRWFDWMSIERHIKNLFNFARKQIRDNNPAYLAYIPRTLKYIIDASQPYPELAALHDFYCTVYAKKGASLACVP